MVAMADLISVRFDGMSGHLMMMARGCQSHDGSARRQRNFTGLCAASMSARRRAKNAEARHEPGFG